MAKCATYSEDGTVSTKRATLRLHMRPEPDGPDALGREPAYRLKFVLKRLLRSAGWRCVRIEPVDAVGELPTSNVKCSLQHRMEA